MLSRRRFLGSIGVSAGTASSAGLFSEGLGRALAAAEEAKRRGASAEESAVDESFWFEVQQAFTVDRSLINLNNGGVCPSPAIVQEAMKRHLDYSNLAPAYTMWEILEPQKEGVRQRLARAFGASTEEIAITRNASESLQVCQFGHDLGPGDEVLTTDQDYPRMITTWQQRERREGIVLRQFSIPVPAENPDQIVSLFEENLTPRTKLIMMCHMINLTGQILPVRQVVEMARGRGIPVIVDGAHAFAHIDFRQSDLNCDYYASSLHKWLFAPHGTGLLYVRKQKIRDLWPMMAAGLNLDKNIRKFEEIGTHPAANFVAIAEALTFHEGIGPARKVARLRYLTSYWAERLLENERVHLNTSLKPGFSGALANFRVDGLNSRDLVQHLWNENRILVTDIHHKDCPGIRVTPALYTTLPELDRFCDGVENVMKTGIKRA